MKHSTWKGVRRALVLLSVRDQRVLLFLMALQMVIALLDLAGVLLLGVVSALAAEAATGTSVVGDRLSIFGQLLPQGLGATIWLAAIAAILLVSKSLTSMLLTKRTLNFIASRQAFMSGSIAERLLNSPITELQSRSSQETTAALMTGVSAIAIGTLGPAILIGAELALVLTLGIGIAFVDPLVALFTVAFFGVVTVLLQRVLGDWAQSLGSRFTQSEIGGMQALQEALLTYREITVSGRRSLFVSRFRNFRWETARVQADTYFLFMVAKYVFEICLVLGGGLLVVFVAFTRDLISAVAIITVFLVASSRIFPSLMRLHTGLASIRNSTGTAECTYQLLDALAISEMENPPSSISKATSKEFASATRSDFQGFSPKIECTDVTFVYPQSMKPALVNVSLSIGPGESVALVGTTGAGKSTLADVILGVLRPSSGSVMISGIGPLDVVSAWPGAVAYVPQDVRVVSGTVRQNVALGISPEDIDNELVFEALERAQLLNFVSQDRSGIDTAVGEHGVQLSGGQRQRLGIARALYTRPRLLVLDEATSALDAETEFAVTETLNSLAGAVTVVVIAHRLATIRNCTQIVYLHDGHVLANGTFDYVRSAVPDFDSQARIMGL